MRQMEYRNRLVHTREDFQGYTLYEILERIMSITSEGDILDAIREIKSSRRCTDCMFCDNSTWHIGSDTFTLCKNPDVIDMDYEVKFLTSTYMPMKQVVDTKATICIKFAEGKREE